MLPTYARWLTDSVFAQRRPYTHTHSHSDHLPDNAAGVRHRSGHHGLPCLHDARLFRIDLRRNRVGQLAGQVQHRCADVRARAGRNDGAQHEHGAHEPPVARSRDDDCGVGDSGGGNGLHETVYFGIWWRSVSGARTAEPDVRVLFDGVLYAEGIVVRGHRADADVAHGLEVFRTGELLFVGVRRFRGDSVGFDGWVEVFKMQHRLRCMLIKGVSLSLLSARQMFVRGSTVIRQHYRAGRQMYHGKIAIILLKHFR